MATIPAEARSALVRPRLPAQADRRASAPPTSPPIPRSHGALRAGGRHAARRRPHELDEHAHRRLPPVLRGRPRQPRHRRGRAHLHRLLPRRHRRHDRPLARRWSWTPSTRACAARAASPRCSPPRMPPYVGAELQRRFGLPFWQFSLTATDANRWVLRMARMVQQAALRPRLQRVLPRHRRRDHRRGRPATARPTSQARQRRPAGRPDPDHQGRRVQRRRGAARGARAARRRRACSMEPWMTNIGIVPPQPGFLEAVRELLRRDRARCSSTTRRTRSARASAASPARSACGRTS